MCWQRGALREGSSGDRRNLVTLRHLAGAPGTSPLCPLLTPLRAGSSMYGYGDLDGPGFQALGDELVSGREPAHAMLSIAVWQGDAAPPFEPPASRAAADAAGGRGVPRTRRRCAPRGPPHRHVHRPCQRPAEHAAYEVAAAVGGADANVDRVRHGHWARAEPPSRARSATIGTRPPLGEHARRSGARASL